MVHSRHIHSPSFLFFHIMLDLKKVRENLEEYKQVLTKRHSDCDVDMILAKDDERKSIQQKVDELKFQQKTLASQQDYE